MKDDYPELRKVERVKDRSQPIGEFLEWLSMEKEIVLAKYHKHTEGCSDLKNSIRMTCGYKEDDLQPVFISIEKLLAEFFEINLDKVEEERRKLISNMIDTGQLKKPKED